MLNTPNDHYSIGQEIPQGTSVYDVDGNKVGRVTLSAMRDGYFVVERGWLLSYEVFLPRTAIRIFDGKELTLSLSKEALKQERWKTPPLESMSGEPPQPIISPMLRGMGLGPTEYGVVQPPSAVPDQTVSEVQPIQRRMTLQASLEAVARLGEGYLVTGAGDEWTAGELLRWIQETLPTSYKLPVYLVEPDTNGNGAIYEVGPRGEVVTDVPLYRIERRKPTVLPL